VNSSRMVELCVHGVSGTPPQDILHCPPEVLQRVAGDKKNAGFYRVREQVDGASHASGSRVREVYSWGKLTSGPARRALFLLLLPFTLVNLAHWMLPRVHRQLPANWAVRLLRLLGLSLTLTLQLAVDATVMDVGAWQCASIPQCDTLHLRWAAAVFHRGLNHRLAISALIPAVLILVLVWMAYSRRPPFGVPPNPAVDVSAPSPLAHREFWSADRSVQRLQMCHLTSWTALSTLVLCGAVVHSSTAGAVISHGA
jgi:hypothetical protein